MRHVATDRCRVGQETETEERRSGAVCAVFSSIGPATITLL